MENQTKNTTVLHTCAACNQTGSCGAKWLLYVEGQSQPKLVHKPCGELMIAGAPQGVKAKLVPSRQLREEWRNKRLTQTFWDKAFANAKPIKARGASVPRPQSAPATVAQAT